MQKTYCDNVACRALIDTNKREVVHEFSIYIRNGGTKGTPSVDLELCEKCYWEFKDGLTNRYGKKFSK